MCQSRVRIPLKLYLLLLTNLESKKMNANTKIGIAKTRSGKNMVYVLKNQNCNFAYSVQDLKKSLKTDIAAKKCICDSKELLNFIMAD